MAPDDQGRNDQKKWSRPFDKKKGIMAFQVYIYIMCVCIHSLNVAFYRIDRMSVCCLDVGFLRDVAGTTLTSRPFFGPDHKAIAPSSSFEGRSAPQKVRTASNQCQLVGW